MKELSLFRLWGAQQKEAAGTWCGVRAEAESIKLLVSASLPSGHIPQTSTSKREIPKDTTLSKDRECSPAILIPQRIPNGTKTNKGRDSITENPTDPVERQWLHIPDSQALQALGMLKILHFANIYKAYLEAIDHSQKPKLSTSLICSLSLSSWKTLCAHLTTLQAQSGYSSHLKKGEFSALATV